MVFSLNCLTLPFNISRVLPSLMAFYVGDLHLDHSVIAHLCSLNQTPLHIFIVRYFPAYRYEQNRTVMNLVAFGSRTCSWMLLVIPHEPSTRSLFLHVLSNAFSLVSQSRVLRFVLYKDLVFLAFL